MMLGMVRRVTTALVCDVCSSPKGTRRYSVGYASRGRPRLFDLCPVHAQPLYDVREAVDRAREEARAALPGKGRRRVRVEDE